MLFVYMIVSWTEMTMNTVMIGLKTLGRLSEMLILNFVFCILLNFSIGLYIHSTNGDCHLQYANYMGCCCVLTFISLFVCLLSDRRLVQA